jgi:hypothetical protein
MLLLRLSADYVGSQTIPIPVSNMKGLGCSGCGLVLRRGGCLRGVERRARVPIPI